MSTSANPGAGVPDRHFVPGAWIRTTPPRSKQAATIRNLLIVGNSSSARGLAAYFAEHPAAGCVVRGFLDDRAPAGGEVLGCLDDLARVALAEFVDEVVLTGPWERGLAERVVREAQRNRLGVRVIPDLFGLDPKCMAFERVGDLPVLRLSEKRKPLLWPLLKRSMDVTLSALTLVVLAPLLAVIALAIRFDSRGPALYRSNRVGKKGRAFVCFKFRTMVEEADRGKQLLRMKNERQGPFFKIADDPRITPLGRWLRTYSLDELLQLWNVLLGEMALVGPRPHPVDDCELYQLEHLRRLEVKPGITGLWQVTARNNPSFEMNMALDLEYIQRSSLVLDLKILYKTALMVMRGGGT